MFDGVRDVRDWMAAAFKLELAAMEQPAPVAQLGLMHNHSMPNPE